MSKTQRDKSTWVFSDPKIGDEVAVKTRGVQNYCRFDKVTRVTAIYIDVTSDSGQTRRYRREDGAAMTHAYLRNIYPATPYDYEAHRRQDQANRLCALLGAVHRTVSQDNENSIVRGFAPDARAIMVDLIAQLQAVLDLEPLQKDAKS